jgi:hypothetical protein
MYNVNDIRKMEEEIYLLTSRYSTLLNTVIAKSTTIKDLRAKEYLQHGVGRRVGIIYRCIMNVFRIFPVNRETVLSTDEQMDVDINLHAFIINIQGLIDNLGLALANENGMIDKDHTEKEQRSSIGLFKKEFIIKLNEELAMYFSTAYIKAWYHEYSVNYRDSLAHRIPAYVTTAGLSHKEAEEYEEIYKQMMQEWQKGWSDKIPDYLNRINELGKANPVFVHSITEKARPVILHPQMLADFSTIEEMINIVLKNIDLTIAST